MISLRDVVTGFGNRDPLAEVWRRSLRGGGGGIAEITGTLPLRYIGNGKPLSDYLIFGNTVQDGTPTPEAPVDVVGCGVWDETQQSYKLPLTVNGTEYPIYLGQVPTTRRIRKLVLTGEENWIDRPQYAAADRFVLSYGGFIKKYSGYCTHYEVEGNLVDTYPSLILNDGTQIIINHSAKGTTTLTDFKQFLRDQYSYGTPVTVWYVLATPTTGIVNEPLHKIGDYADTVSFAQAEVVIPTVNGANVLDMTSTVKSSEVYIKGKGIKPTNDPNFENGG